MKLPLLDFLTQNFYNINERNEECTIEQYELELPKETDEIISTFTKKRFKKMVFDKTNPFEFGCDFDDVEDEFSFLPPRVDVKVVLVGDDTSKFKRAVVKELNSVFRQVYLCGQKWTYTAKKYMLFSRTQRNFYVARRPNDAEKIS
mgnify:CR=1 FL=1